jgi:monoamine oxidase
VIVAMAPMLAGRIDYEPALPPLRDGLTQRVPQGSVIKYQAVYPTPFWRAQGLNGYANSDRPPVSVTFDNSPPDGKPGVLLGFVEGADARRLWRLSAAARRRAVLGSFQRLVGGFMDARVLCGLHAPGRVDRLRPRVARAGRAAALGRDGDR